jgi:hypothetical protein
MYSNAELRLVRGTMKLEHSNVTDEGGNIKHTMFMGARTNPLVV